MNTLSETDHVMLLKVHISDLIDFLKFLRERVSKKQTINHFKEFKEYGARLARLTAYIDVETRWIENNLLLDSLTEDERGFFDAGKILPKEMLPIIQSEILDFGLGRNKGERLKSLLKGFSELKRNAP